MKNICVVTSTRADYGLLKPLLFRLDAEPQLALRLVVTGAHLRPEFGLTVEEIEADGLPIHRRIPIQEMMDTPAAISRTMANALAGFADYFAEHRPDLLLALGDRYEMEAVCCAAYNARIPIGHISGGELTEGVADDGFRHAITKMSVLHFTGCEAYRRRVIQLGEQPDTVYNVGALGVENILRAPLLSRAELAQDLDFSIEDEPYAVVTLHPVLAADAGEMVEIHELMAALDAFPSLRLIITKANADAGGQEINRLWEAYAARRSNCLLVASLGMKRYLSALKYAQMMIGNSSSGILEGPASRIPTVDIGDRERGRMAADSVIHCDPDREAIITAMRKAQTAEFQAVAKNVVNLYGDGDTSRRIVEMVKERLAAGLCLEKKFYDIAFEVKP